MDDSETEVDPQNPNPRGAHGTEVEINPLDEIVKTFNERWFQGWSATPEEQRVRLLNMAESIRSHPDFNDKYKNNPDPHNQQLAFDKLFKDIMLQRRKDDLEFYKLFAGDEAFKVSLMQSMQRMVGYVINCRLERMRCFFCACYCKATDTNISHFNTIKGLTC